MPDSDQTETPCEHDFRVVESHGCVGVLCAKCWAKRSDQPRLILACQRCPVMVSLRDFDGYFHLWDDGEEGRVVLDGGACIPLGWRIEDGLVTCPAHEKASS